MKKFDSYSTPLTSPSVKDVARGHLIKHIIEGSNVIDVRFKPKMYYEMSRKIAANFVILKNKKKYWLITNTRQRFAHPLFCQQINRSRSLSTNHTCPPQSFSTRVLPERKGNVDNQYHMTFLKSNIK